MKTTILYNTIYLLLFIPAIVCAHNVTKDKYTKEKNIKKEYTVNKNALLKVDNSYGNLDITTYEGNKIYIEVSIKVSGNDEDKVLDKLEEIDVYFESTPALVSAKTIFSKSKKSWWNFSNNNTNMKINYTIKLPITNNVELSNDYGSINLDKLEGKAIINCDYGKITTKELMAEDNSITFDYTNNSYFEYINGGNIAADYSEFTVGKTKNLSISADYTKSNIEYAEDINFNCDYGAIKINQSNNINGNGDYLNMRFGTVYKNLNIKGDYGSLKIDEMGAKAGNINIKSDYLGITIGYNPEYHFNFEMNIKYGDARNTKEFTFTETIKKSVENYYRGYYGSKSNNLIKIDSDYGNVTFKQN
ncbi:GSKIP domain-containing protein [Gaetbulibacter saemankumensis]|uniref:hypothetical protein n=1 Tax=Gaetbulibacter saemankumensis TaxID=311208 RepID=UPI00040D35EA|nr:hypothetical protein [Gaetbulibacter saemankumensis]